MGQLTQEAAARPEERRADVVGPDWPPPRPWSGLDMLMVRIGAVLLLVAGVLQTMGGAVRWQGCLEPSRWAAACPMHDDAWALLPGIDLTTGLGYLVLGAATLPLAIGLSSGMRPVSRQLTAAAGALGLLGFAWFGLDTLLPLDAEARSAARIGYADGGLSALAALRHGASTLPDSTLPHMLATFPTFLLPVLAFAGSAAVLLAANAPDRRPRMAVGVAVAAVGAANSLLTAMVLVALSGSHDEGPGWGLVQGIVAMFAGVVVLLALARRTRGEAGAASAPDGTARGIGVLLLTGAAVVGVMGLALQWQHCLEPGATGCTADGAAGVRGVNALLSSLRVGAAELLDTSPADLYLLAGALAALGAVAFVSAALLARTGRSRTAS